MLIIVVVIDQFKYDNFHSKRKDIYRIESVDKMSRYAMNKYASTAFPLYNELTTKYDLVDNAVVLNNFYGTGILDEKRIKLNGFYTTESFFQMFDFELTNDSYKDPLSEPYTIVIKEETAKKFFGNENAIGKFIQVDSLGQFKITGVVKKPVHKSQFQFNSLLSIKTRALLEKSEELSDIMENWKSFYFSYIYILVENKDKIPSIQNALNNISFEKYKDLEEHQVEFNLTPFNKIVPGKMLGNEIGVFMPKVFIIFLGALSLVIIISAAFNYTSLSMARSLLRAKEVGVRKTLGAKRKQIIFQFLWEAIVIALIALLIAIGILQILLPGFTGMELMSLLEINPQQDLIVYIWFFVFAVFTGFVAGILPSVYISAFNPIKVLKGVTNIKLLSKITLRKILLVSQFVFSMIFIISIILIYKQMSYMINAKKGFDHDVVYNIRLQKNDLEKVKNYYSQFPEVKNIAGVGHIAGVGTVYDTDIRLNLEDEKMTAHYFAVDENYIDVMGLELLEGEQFNSNLSRENESVIIVDEELVKKFQFGSNKDAIGKSIIVEDFTLVEIIGVVKNYQYVAIFLPTRPLMLRYLPNKVRYAALRIEQGNTMDIVKKFEAEWKKFDKYNQFEGKFIKTEINEYYAVFNDILYTVGFTSVLAIIIACLGLLGMATYSTQTRVKEIGVRKVFGAKNKSIILLISKSYITLFIISALIAGPLAYLINNMWLQYLSNHTPFGFGIIFTGIFIIIVAGMLTIASQTLKAANTNPAESLRYE